MAHSVAMPPELWDEVFVRLDRESLCSCSVVCHEWLPLVQALLLRTLRLIEPVRAERVLSELGESAAWTHIRCIRFAKLEGDINDAVISTVVEILRRATRLQVLELRLVIFDRNGLASPNIRACVDPRDARYLVACAPWVTHVQISLSRNYMSAERWDAWDMQTVFENLPNAFLFPKFHLLRLFSISLIPAALFLAAFCKLRLLWIVSARSTEGSLRAQAIAASCPELRTLMFDMLPQPAELASLARFRNLRTVHLAGEPGLQPYLDVLPPTVEKLVIGGCYHGRGPDPSQHLVFPAFVRKVEVHLSMAGLPDLASAGRIVEVRDYR